MVNIAKAFILSLYKHIINLFNRYKLKENIASQKLENSIDSIL